MITKVFYKAVRHGTTSAIKGEVPEEIGTDPIKILLWIGEKYDWEFIPTQLKIVKVNKESDT